MVEWLGVLWAWIIDPVYMAELRQERLTAAEERRAARQAVVAASRRHTTTMSVKQTEWTLKCSCGWQRMAYLDGKNTAVARKICDDHERTG